MQVMNLKIILNLKIMLLKHLCHKHVQVVIYP